MPTRVSTLFVLIHVTCLLNARRSWAQEVTSLYIPGFDPQPLSASVLGVGSDSRTTLAISPAQPSNGEDPSGLTGPFTLVIGPDDVAYTLAAPGEDGSVQTIIESCAIDEGGNANCIVQMGSVTTTETETPSSFAVEFGGGGSNSGSGTSTAASSVTTSPTTSGSGSVSASASGSPTATQGGSPSLTGSPTSSSSSPSGSGAAAANKAGLVISLISAMLTLASA